MKKTTKLTVTNRSDSVRTPVPRFIAKKMQLGRGDIMEWSLERVDGAWVGTMRKVER